MTPRIRPAVVLYHPDADDIAAVLELAARGWGPVAVVNSASHEQIATLRTAGIELVENAANVGLARALNQGLERIFAAGADYAMLLDQDTRPPPAMMSDLLARADAFMARGAGRLGCLGPRPVDRKGGDIGGRGEQTLVPIATVITSGQVIPRAAFDAVGGMWNELFIDYIDHEWCFRAKAQGFAVLMAQDVVMPHDMGDAAVGPRGYQRIIHRSPFRHYHWVRNALWMQRCPHIPRRWRIAELARLLYRIPTFLAASTDRAASLIAIRRALRDGLAGPSARTYAADSVSAPASASAG